MFSSTFVVLALTASAFGTIFTTAPVASTTWASGTKVQVTWQEGPSSPSLADFGQTKISVYAGNVQQQTSLQEIGTVDVSQVSSIDFTPTASIGPNGNEYFIRFESISLKDATTPTYPALAFSAKFTLSGMTGVFSADVLSQIAGQSTAGSVGGSTPAAAAATSGSASASSPAASTTGSSKPASSGGASASKTGTAATAAKSNGALAGAASIVGVVAAFVGVVALL